MVLGVVVDHGIDGGAGHLELQPLLLDELSGVVAKQRQMPLPDHGQTVGLVAEHFGVENVVGVLAEICGPVDLDALALRRICGGDSVADPRSVAGKIEGAPLVLRVRKKYNEL